MKWWKHLFVRCSILFYFYHLIPNQLFSRIHFATIRSLWYLFESIFRFSTWMTTVVMISSSTSRWSFGTYISTNPHMYILHTTTELNEIIMSTKFEVKSNKDQILTYLAYIITRFAIIFGTTEENLKITIAISYSRIFSYSLSRNADEDVNPLKLNSLFVFIVSFVPVMEYSDYNYIYIWSMITQNVSKVLDKAFFNGFFTVTFTIVWIRDL